MRMSSSNPVFRQANSYTYVTDRPVTYANVAIKTIILLAVAAVSAYLAITNIETLSIGWIIGAMIVAFIAVMVGSRSSRLAPLFAFIYAAAEGVVLGIVSILYSAFYEGIVPTAIITTFVVFVVMLLLFSTNIIKVNQKFASFMVVALISVIIMSLLTIFLPDLASSNIYYVIVFISAALSAFFLLLDFQRIKDFVDSGSDHSVGWVLSLGLMVTLVWIYVEMLRLLAITSRR
ncbi:MAG: Bax inhibitor-1/YccA family protein [Candidatus Izemoplasmatales bacterium]